MEYVIAAIVLGGFGYFIYRKIKARNDRPAGTGGGGGGVGGGTGEHNQH